LGLSQGKGKEISNIKKKRKTNCITKGTYTEKSTKKEFISWGKEYFDQETGKTKRPELG